MTVPDFLSHLPKPLPIRDLRVFLRSRSFKWGTLTMMGDKFSNNFIRSYQVFQMGDNDGGQVVRYFHPLIIPGLPNQGRSAPTESPHWCPGLPDIVVGLTNNNNIGCCWFVVGWLVLSHTYCLGTRSQSLFLRLCQLPWFPGLHPDATSSTSSTSGSFATQTVVWSLTLTGRNIIIIIDGSIDPYPGARNKYQQTKSQIMI